MIGALLLSVVALCGCKNKTAQKSEPVDITNNMGMYVATLPCADCPGIVTHLTLNADSTAALTSLYMDADNTSETVDGKWTFADSVFTLKTNDGETLMYKLVSVDKLAQVGEMKEVKEEYMLKKEAEMLADNFVGTYNSSYDEKDAYKQTLTITKVDDRQVDVTIVQTSGAGKGCEFKGQGHIVNNQIEINMKDVNPDMKSVMTIRFTPNGNELNVFTSKFDDRNDLMFFCGGGGSLAGDYRRE